MTHMHICTVELSDELVTDRTCVYTLCQVKNPVCCLRHPNAPYAHAQLITCIWKRLNQQPVRKTSVLSLPFSPPLFPHRHCKDRPSEKRILQTQEYLCALRQVDPGLLLEAARGGACEHSGVGLRVRAVGRVPGSTQQAEIAAALPTDQQLHLQPRVLRLVSDCGEHTCCV